MRIGFDIRLKEKGFIKKIESLIEDLRENGYWLSDEIVQLTIKLAGE